MNKAASPAESKSSYSFTPDQNENAFLNLAFNIAIPVLLLNKLTDPLKNHLGDMGPTVALLVALAFPIAYGTYDYLKRKKKNVLSLLGFLNILFTGGLALLQLKGIWFAVKEAAFPLLIGFFVYLSVHWKKPFIELFIYNENLLNIQLIEQRLNERNQGEKIHQHLKTSTVFLAASFLLSAVLNFILARIIFVPIDENLSKSEYAAVLNQQIADMTWLSWFVIMIPSMLCLFGILWHLFSGIQKMTGLKLNDLVRAK